ncbi:hypothetical protein ACE14D_20945 [Streptomyces sp. Act-28]
MTVQPTLEQPSRVHGRDVELRSVAAALDAPRHGGRGLLVVTAAALWRGGRRTG